MSELQHSPLESAHEKLGGRLVPFAGWNMPVQYSSILSEHAAVRNGVGIFDISHMGQFWVSGPDAGAWLNRMLTNNIDRLGLGQGQYTLMLNERGGVIDDLIVYRNQPEEFFLVVNASMIEDDFFWLASHQDEFVTLRNESALWAGMAVQGPLAAGLFDKVFPGQSLPPRNGIAVTAAETIICRTGYTGEDGFEFFCAAEQGITYWERFIAAGATPCGLGARDTLRLEMGYPLNGSDLSPKHSPIEAGLGSFCDLTKTGFIGCEALAHQKAVGSALKLCAIQYTEKGAPPRAHYPVLSPDGELLGELTSGALSPSLMTGIAMAYLPAAHSAIGTPVEIDIRGRRVPAKVVKKPFYRK